jgi:hypothetical protein
VNSLAQTFLHSIIMSQAFLIAFFPSITDILQRKFPITFAHFFPNSVAQRCPEFTLQIPWITATTIIRNPILSLGATFGIIIGFSGAWLILQNNRMDDELASDTAPRHSVSSSIQQLFFEIRIQGRHYHNDNHLRFFALGFLFFDLMNLFALPLHCFVTRPSDVSSRIHSLPQEYPILWAFDCLMTGWSAMALAMGFYSDTICNNTELGNNKLISGVKVMTLWNKYLSIGSITSCFTFLAFKAFNITIGIELMYLLPVIIAATRYFTTIFHHFLFYYCVSFETRKNKASLNGHTSFDSLLGCTTSGFGILCLFFGIFFDATACQNLGQSWGDTLMAPTTTFWGCDFVFLGLLICFQRQKKQKQKNCLEAKLIQKLID